MDLRVTGSPIITSYYNYFGNYLFEWCVWIGYAVYGLAFVPWGLIAIVPQAIILASILGVTGIPPTEIQAIRSKGDVYRAYQQRVSESSRCRRSVRDRSATDRPPQAEQAHRARPFGR